MGNQTCCSTRSKHSDDYLDKNELMILMDFFSYIANQNEETKNKKVLDQIGFEKIFNDNPRFGALIFNFASQKLGQFGQIAFEPLINILQQFLNQPTQQDNTMQKFSLCELVILIIIKKPKVQNKSLKELEQIYIGTDQAYEVLQLIITMLIQSTSKRIVQVDNRPIIAIIDGLFGNLDSVKIPIFMAQINAQYPLINQLIKSYFSHKLLQKPFSSIKYPKMIQESYIIGREWLALMALSSKDISQQDQMSRTYCSIKDGLSFELFSRSLIESGANNLIIATYDIVDNNSSSKKNSIVFASFNSVEWISDQNEQEFTNNQIVFQLLPEMRVLNGEILKQRNHQYSNSSNYFYYQKQNRVDYCGFGMGKDPSNGRFLFWLDNDLVNQSYCTPQLKFQQLDSQFQLKILEVWKFELLPGNYSIDRNSYIQRNSLSKNKNHQPPPSEEFQRENFQQQTMRSQNQEFAQSGQTKPNIESQQVSNLGLQNNLNQKFQINKQLSSSQLAQENISDQQLLVQNRINEETNNFKLFEQGKNDTRSKLSVQTKFPDLKNVLDMDGPGSPCFKDDFNNQNSSVQENTQNYYTQNYNQIVQKAQQFNNPSYELIRSTSQNPQSQNQDLDRLSQSIVDKYTSKASYRASSNTPARSSNNMKNVNDILKRYEKN